MRFRRVKGEREAVLGIRRNTWSLDVLMNKRCKFIRTSAWDLEDGGCLFIACIINANSATRDTGC